MSDFMQWVAHGVKQGRLEKNPRIALYLGVLVVALTLLAAFYLLLVSQTAAKGRHIEQLQAELFRLQRENERLEIEIAEKSAVSRLVERATALGFVPAEHVEFLAGSGE